MGIVTKKTKQKNHIQKLGEPDATFVNARAKGQLPKHTFASGNTKGSLELTRNL
jgi:hypothetical protein